MARQHQTQWNNRSNAEFYAQLNIPKMVSLAAQCGLLGCPDLEAVKQHLRGRRVSINHILEVGGCFGRVAGWCQQEFPNTRLTLVERNVESANYLRQRFQNNSKVNVLTDSILTTTLPQSIDLAFWMWAGFLDFTHEEKQIALKRIGQSLSRQGILAIEIPKTVGSQVGYDTRGNMTLNIEGASWYGHICTAEELLRLFLASGLIPVAELPYTTTTNLKRTIHLVQKLEVA